MKALRVFPVLALALALACGDGPVLPDPTFQIEDAAHNGGNEHFYWLPPMVQAPSFTGTFDGTLGPVVRITGPSGDVVAAFTTETGPGSETVRVVPEDEHYIVNWHTNDFALDPALTYRIGASVNGTVLGFADVDVVSSGRELKNVNTGEYIALKDGRTLPIRFRIEEGALANQPPTLDPIASRTVISGQPQAVPLTNITSGAIDEHQTLTVTATIDTPGGDDVLGPLTVVYTSPDAVGSLEFTPPVRETLSAPVQVTVTVADGAESLTRSFSVVVGPALPFVILPAKDNTIYAESGLKSNGAGSTLFVGRTSEALDADGIMTTYRRSLIQFPQSALQQIPANATITSVQLALNLTAASGSDGARILFTHRLTEDWGEAGSTAEPGPSGTGEGAGGPAVTDDATFTKRFFETNASDGIDWAVIGGTFVSTSSGNTAIENTGPVLISSAGLLTDVEGWMNGAFGNFGWILKLSNTDETTAIGSARGFDSRTGDVPPALVINYTVPVPD